MGRLPLVSMLSFLLATQVVIAQQLKPESQPASARTLQQSDIWQGLPTPPGAERLRIILSDPRHSQNQAGSYDRNGNDTVLRYASLPDLIADFPDLQKAVQEICSSGDEGKLGHHLKYVCFGKSGFWEPGLDFSGHW